MSFFEGEWSIHRTEAGRDIRVDVVITDVTPNAVNIKSKPSQPIELDVHGYILTPNIGHDPRFFSIYFEEPFDNGSIRHYLGKVTYPCCYNPRDDPADIDSNIEGKVTISTKDQAGRRVIGTTDDWTGNRPPA